MPWAEPWWQLVRPYGRYLYYRLFPTRRPPYFNASWTFPTAPLAPSPARPPAFFFFPMNDWHVRIQRSQHLARALAARGHLCVYVNPHLGLEFAAPRPFSRTPQWRALEPNVFELHVHLPREHRLDSRPLLPGEVRRIERAVESTVDRWQLGPVVLLTSTPVWVDVVERLRARRGYPILYDCHDLLGGFPGVPPPVVGLEQRLLALCDRVAYSSATLMATVQAQHPAWAGKSALVRNGVTPADFDTAPRAPGRAARPTVGYMGALESWFDCDAVRAAADRHPQVDFELVGAVRDAKVWGLKDRPNIRFTGETPYGELRHRMAAWSAAMIPFLRNPLTLATNPIKLYEYFSAGLPVVATRLPEMEPFAGLAYLADSPAEFADGVSRALAETGGEFADRRKAVAANETWAQRAEAIERLVAGE